MLLDADVLIDLWRGYPPAVSWFAGVAGPLPAAGLAAMELLDGCQNLAERRAALRVLKQFRLQWPSEAAMLRALWDLSVYRLSHGMRLVDALIAATAIEMGEPLATFNIRHFSAVPGLAVIQPYTR